MADFNTKDGIAVSFGMDIANFISVKLGFIEKDVYQRVHFQLKQIFTGSTIKNLSVKEFEKALSQDKKNTGNTYQLILTKGIGNMLKHGITPNKDFTRWLGEYFSLSS